MMRFADLLGQVDDEGARERVLNLAARVHMIDATSAQMRVPAADIEPLLEDIFRELVWALRAKRYPLPARDRLRTLIREHFSVEG